MSIKKEKIIDIINGKNKELKEHKNINIKSKINSSNLSPNFNQLKLGDKLVMHSFDKIKKKQILTNVTLWKKVQCEKYLFGVVASNNVKFKFKEPLTSYISPKNFKPKNFNNPIEPIYFKFDTRPNIKFKVIDICNDPNYIPPGIKNLCDGYGYEIKDISSPWTTTLLTPGKIWLSSDKIICK